MMHSNRRTVLIALAAVAAEPAFSADRVVRGSGRAATEQRTASGFDRIGIAGPLEVEIRQGSREGIEITGDDNLLALIETRVEGAGSLRIGAKDGIELLASRPITVRIDVIKLAGIAVGGSGHVLAKGLRTARLGVSIGGAGRVDLPGLEAERLTVEIGGSGQARADGHAGTLALNVGGSGSCALRQLAAEEASVSIAGSGSADVNVNRKLSVSIAGSGHVTHVGAAVPSVSIVGSGNVQRG